MREIPLTKGAVALVDDEAFPALMQFNWYLGPSGYAARGVRWSGRFRCVFMHRVLAVLLWGDDLRDWQVDHRDGNRLNNTRGNLRLATSGENSLNRGKPRGVRTSEFIGVHWHAGKHKWVARVTWPGGRWEFGFDDEREAAAARDSVVRERNGAFARLNFPIEGELAAIAGRVNQTSRARTA